MKSPAHASRKQSVDDFLLAANAGCMLVLVLAIGLPFVGIGGLFIYLGCDKMRNQAEVHDMAIIVPATVVSSNVRQSSTNMDSASKAHWADIEFRYEYGGRIWDSDKVWLVQEGGSAAEAQAVVDRIPKMRGYRRLSLRRTRTPRISKSGGARCPMWR
jgi:hypothetical protein